MEKTFEWDENKAKENIRNHKGSFEEASTVFKDPFSITIFDPDHSIDEDRDVDMGCSSTGRVLVVVYTERGQNMKKAISKSRAIKDNEMRREYDFTGGVRGKHDKTLQKGYAIKIRKSDGTTVVKHVKPVDGAAVLAPDVLEYFPDSEAVNKALRSLIALIPRKHKTAAKRASYA